MIKIPKEKKKLIFDSLLVLMVLVAVAAVSFLLLYAFDVIYFDEGIAFNAELFSAFKNAWYGWIVFMLFQMLQYTNMLLRLELQQLRIIRMELLQL